MWDFLSFNTFITKDVLIFFYYIGAVGIPIALFLFKDYMLKHFSLVQRGYMMLQKFYDALPKNQKRRYWSVLILLFLCAELCWRMIFEAMIGYFDMHDYLHMILETNDGK